MPELGWAGLGWAAKMERAGSVTRHVQARFGRLTCNCCTPS